MTDPTGNAPAPTSAATSAMLAVEVRYRPRVPATVITAHIRANLAPRHAELQLGSARAGTILIAGGGPSLIHALGEIGAAQRDGAKLLAVNEVPHLLAGHGIRPWAAAHVGPVDLTIHSLGAPITGVRYYMASICPPEAFRRLIGHEVVMWHPSVDGLGEAMRAAGAAPAAGFVGGGYTVVLRCLRMAAVLGFRSIALYGGDSSFSGEFHAYRSVADDIGYHRLTVDCAGQRFTTSPELLGQALAFPDLRSALAAEGVTIEVHGEGLLPHLAALADGVGTIPPVRLVEGDAELDTARGVAVISAEMF